MSQLTRMGPEPRTGQAMVTSSPGLLTRVPELSAHCSMVGGTGGGQREKGGDEGFRKRVWVGEMGSSRANSRQQLPSCMGFSEPHPCQVRMKPTTWGPRLTPWLYSYLPYSSTLPSHPGAGAACVSGLRTGCRGPERSEGGLAHSVGMAGLEAGLLHPGPSTTLQMPRRRPHCGQAAAAPGWQSPRSSSPCSRSPSTLTVCSLASSPAALWATQV